MLLENSVPRSARCSTFGTRKPKPVSECATSARAYVLTTIATGAYEMPASARPASGARSATMPAAANAGAASTTERAV